MLIHAAYELLGEEGWPATSVRGVCRRSGLNPRYFYESFDSIDDLVVAVYDQIVDELSEAVRAELAAADRNPSAITRAALGATVRYIDEDRRRGRILYVEALGNEALNRRRLENAHRLVEELERTSVARRKGLAPGEPVVLMRAAILVGGFTELLVSWLEGRLDVSRDQLVDDATLLFLALRDAADAIAGGRTPRPT